MRSNPISRQNPLNKLTRRQFIQRSAMAGALIGFPTIIPSSVLGQGAPSNRINVVQIGCGRIAKDMDIPGLLRHPDKAQIIAVCDVDSKRAANAKAQVEASYAKAPGRKATIESSGDYHDFLTREDIDAVSISTPDHWHAQPVVEAALAGKDIYVQKPLTMTIAEGRLVSDAVRSRDRVLQIGSQQRSTRQFHRACQLVRNGRIGKVHKVRIGLPTDPSGGNAKEMAVPENLDYDMWLGCTPEVYYTEDRVHPRHGLSRPGWLRLNQFTRGMITGWGAHHVDIAHWGLNHEYTGPLSINGTAEWPGPESFWNVHGPYSIEMEYPNGSTMLISDKFPNGIRFEGEDGWIWVSRGGAAVTASDPVSQQASKAINASNPEWLKEDLSDDKVQLHRSPKWDHHLDWLVAVRKRTEPVTNVETGHRACSACTVAWIGMRLGQPLQWDPKKEQFTDETANTLTSLSERAPHGALTAAKKAGFKSTL